MPADISRAGSGSLSTNKQSQQNNKGNSGINFEGSLWDNAKTNAQAISSSISTLVGGLFGYDPEGRQAVIDIVRGFKENPNESSTNLVNAILDTYNLSLDEIGNMSLGDMTKNVLEGAWQHPIDAFFDVVALKGIVAPSKATKAGRLDIDTLKRGEKISKQDFLVREAEAATIDNVKLHSVGNEFVNKVEDISKRYSPDDISKAMQAVETIGFKNAPRSLLPIMQELNQANDIYKQFTRMSGADILDDIEFAARELLAKEYKISFEDTLKLKQRNTQMYQDAVKYVEENNVKPLFHLKPKIYDVASEDIIPSELLKRKFGTIDYKDAAKDLSGKAAEFVNKVIDSEILRTPEKINSRIEKVNKITGSNIQKLDTKGLLNNKLLRELNSELKKNMLLSGIYLGANVLTTTLSILNNFNMDAVIKTLGDMPRFRLVRNLPEATTPILNHISKINNYMYRPIASVDRYLENVAMTYAKHLGPDKIKFIQSAMPSKVETTNPVLNAVKELVPFGSYPAAAVQELGANLKYKPGKSLLYNQIQKVGQAANIQAQESQGIKPNRAKMLRINTNGDIKQHQIIVTPIQAANMFLLGQQGDAIQIPVLQFINNILSGKGDPSIFEVDGRKYKIDENLNIKNAEGETFNMLPVLAQIGRALVGPERFVNDVIIPIVSNRYVKDEGSFFNKAVSDSQYASMSSQIQKRVVDNAREKIGKRLLGTYEYNYYEPNKYISKSTKRKVIRKYNQRRQLEQSLRRK